MYVCICNAITETDIREAAESGVDNFWALQSELGVATGCGTCAETATEILTEVRDSGSDDGFAQPVIYEPALV